MKRKVTVVIEYDDDDFSFDAGMLTEDLPDGEVCAVAFGDILNDEVNDEN